MKRRKMKLTFNELLLFAGILVALAAILLSWTEMPAFDLSSALPACRERVLNGLPRLAGETFSWLR